jgi:hypothetical protein
LFSDGTLSVNGSFDEVTVSTTSGSQTITTTSTFTVPTYNVMTVTLEGARGANGANGGDYNGAGGPCGGGSGGTGAVGGRSVKTYYGGGAGPSYGSSITITANTTLARFGFGTNPTANKGGDGTNGGDAGYKLGGPEMDQDSCYNGDAGTNGTTGTASGGDTNTTGGSTISTTRVVISWS